MRLRRWRLLIRASVAVALVVVAALLGGGWYFSDVIKAEGFECDWLDPPLDLQVLAIGEGRVTLRATALTGDASDLKRDGTYGLESVASYDQVGDILETGDQQVVRRFIPLNDTTNVGHMARLDHFAFPGDPREAFAFDFQDVLVQTPLGKFPAWRIDGSSDTWVIAVHGRRVGRREALRLLPTTAKLGLPTLVITYRNDFWAPKTEDCFYRYGQTEWEDLQGAVRYAIEHGAEHLILVGYSYGGAIVTSYLYEAPEVAMVRGVVLDSPMLNLNVIIAHSARERNIPKPLVWSAKSIAGARFGIDWGQLNYLSRAQELSAPILLFHGDADDIVPVETSDKLAEMRPDIVRYVRCAGAAHARSWNRCKDAYEAVVHDFLRDLTR